MGRPNLRPNDDFGMASSCVTVRIDEEGVDLVLDQLQVVAPPAALVHGFVFVGGVVDVARLSDFQFSSSLFLTMSWMFSVLLGTN